MATTAVRVRIAVVVDEEGDWSSIGYCKMKDDERHVAADGIMGNRLRWFWLEADLPRPEVEKRMAAEVIEIQSGND